MTTLFINGKFTAQPVTGVQRFATEIVLGVDRLLAEAGARQPWVLLSPPGGQDLPLRHVRRLVVGSPSRALHQWEQWTLPLAAKGGLLLNLAGSCPLWRRGQVCVLHDAAVFDHPQAYSRAFVAWYRLNFRVQARRAGMLLTVSGFSQERLARHLGVPASRFSVLPEGADHLASLAADDGILESLGVREHPFLLSVGSANPTKNLRVLHSAFAPLSREGRLRLVIVGRQRPQVFSEGPAEEIVPGVIHAGPVNDSQLKALYRRALALVMPTRYEGFGLPALEAMAEGCPVIAARAGALPEVCGEVAIWVEVDDRLGLERAMRRVLEEPALCAERARAGLERARAWTWRDAATRLLQLLESRA